MGWGNPGRIPATKEGGSSGPETAYYNKPVLGTGESTGTG